MQPYSVRAAEVACASQLVVLVLLSAGNDDIELICMGRGLSGVEQLPSREDCARRRLRSVGIVGLTGTRTSVAFKEPLEGRVVEAIAQAFAEYVRVLIGEDFAEQTAAAEVAELERMYALPDPRTWPPA